MAELSFKLVSYCNPSRLSQGGDVYLEIAAVDGDSSHARAVPEQIVFSKILLVTIPYNSNKEATVSQCLQL